MMVLTKIKGVPLYTTINEALEWAEFNGISGYHVHKYEGIAGYMGGKNNSESLKYPVDLPIKEKTNNYAPPVGSRVISIKDGKATEYTATPDIVFKQKNKLPLDLTEEDKKLYIPKKRVAQQVSQTPTTQITTQPVTSTSSYSGGGGGGY